MTTLAPSIRAEGEIVWLCLAYLCVAKLLISQSNGYPSTLTTGGEFHVQPSITNPCRQPRVPRAHRPLSA
jgi:hypothetical protein